MKANLGLGLMEERQGLGREPKRRQLYADLGRVLTPVGPVVMTVFLWEAGQRPVGSIAGLSSKDQGRNPGMLSERLGSQLRLHSSAGASLRDGCPEVPAGLDKILNSSGEVQKPIWIPEEKKTLQPSELWWGQGEPSGWEGSLRRGLGEQKSCFWRLLCGELLVLLSCHMTSWSFLFFVCKAQVVIRLLPAGVSLMWLSMRLVLGATPDVPNHALLGRSGNLYLQQKK